MCVYIYIYIHTYICVCVYIYIYIKQKLCKWENMPDPSQFLTQHPASTGNVHSF